MTCNRRTFLGLAAATGAAGCMSTKPATDAADASKFDDNLSVFVTDIHIGGKQLDGGSEAPTYTQGRLSAFVDEVLAMKPLPRRVVSFGDLAYLRGNPDDYATSKPILKRLEDAGIELVFCMGNHDRRSEFNKAWPGHLEKSPVPGKFVRVVSLGTSDLVVLDCLQGTDDRPWTDNGPVPGKLTKDVLDWCKKDFPTRKRPFFVSSHFPIGDLRVNEKKNGSFAIWLLENAPMCVGYIHGHDHRWRPEWSRGNWKSPKTIRTLCLPSNGLWGDIGHATFLTSADRAVCSLHIRDFYFPRKPMTDKRPAVWKLKVEENSNATCTFLYDREGV